MRQFIRYGFGLFLFILLATNFQAITAQAKNLEGIVTVDQLNVRSSDSTNSNIVIILKKGDKVVVKGTKGDWYRITVQAKEGFVSKQYIEVTTAKTKASKKIETIINVNGKQLELEFEPPMENNRILVPFRAIGESMGIDVTWNQAKQQIIAIDQNANKQVIFTIDEVNALVNGETFKLGAAPKLTEKRTLLPLRFFSETFGAKVKWDQANRTANIDRGVNGEEVTEGADPVVNPIELTGLQAKVTAGTLNIRTGPSTNGTIIAKLLKDQTVDVISSTNEWLKVSTEGVEGYISSAYVEIYQADKRIRVLASPVFETQKGQSLLTWSKLGGTTVQSKLVDNVLQLTTDANLIEEIFLVNNVVKRISYERTKHGTVINIKLKDGYTALTQNKGAATSITFLKKSKSGKVIVLDAGHGGKDPGTNGNGLDEKEIVLDVSQRLQKLLEDADFTVLLTRDDDTFIKLGERVEFANKNNADAFISIHVNSAASTSANGTETYWNKNYSGEDSKKLAEEIQAKLIEKLKTFNRGVKEANFQVIKYTEMPSVLVELGFVSNKKDADLLAKDEFREKYAQAIFEGIESFFE